MKLIISFFLIVFFFNSCTLENKKPIKEIISEKKILIKNKIIHKKESKKTEINNKIFYYLGEEYYIEGVKYIPKENYKYAEKGLATFYGKELHNVKTINNDLNKVTELLGRHKTLPIPSTVKITNLENGLSLIIKINDRHDDNTSIIQVSRKVAQLLKFYKNKIARVKVEILSDPSKQMKIVTQSMNDPDFDNTIDSAPTESVEIFDLGETSEIIENQNIDNEIPIELTQEEVLNQDLYLKIHDFTAYDEAKNTMSDLNIQFKNTIQKEGENYTLIIGPLENADVNNLVSTFISKGYKNTEIIIY
tara:strand:+ start:2864 stop:3778 length:915 start_codon:yes stop_codon:yes gene_type:complete